MIRSINRQMSWTKELCQKKCEWSVHEVFNILGNVNQNYMETLPCPVWKASNRYCLARREKEPLNPVIRSILKIIMGFPPKKKKIDVWTREMPSDQEHCLSFQRLLFVSSTCMAAKEPSVSPVPWGSTLSGTTHSWCSFMQSKKSTHVIKPSFKKIKSRTIYDPAIPLGYLPKETLISI